jgi:hypothetical protein
VKIRILILTAALAALTCPVLAQGTFNPGGSNDAWKSGYGARPSSPGFAPPPPRYGAAPPAAPAGGAVGGYARYAPIPSEPAAQPFKPYGGYAGSSVYSRPSGYGSNSGAKPCETSVYVNACDRRR